MIQSAVFLPKVKIIVRFRFSVRIRAELRLG